MAVIPFFEEERINTVLPNVQREPDIGMDDIGKHVIVYESVEQDGNKTGVFARFSDATGAASQPEFRVNAITLGEQSNPAVAMSGDGKRFAVVWQDESDHTDENDASEDGVFARVYSGIPFFNGSVGTIKNAFRVNTTVKNDQQNPDIAMDQEGNFVVVWESENQAGPNTSTDIVAQRFDQNGNPLGQEILVNKDAVQGDQDNVSVAMNDTGDFVVVWESDDGNNTGIFAQRYNSSGGTIGSIFQVNAGTAGAQTNPKVAIRPGGGNIVVSWHSNPPGIENDGLYARTFSATNQATSNDFRVDTTTKFAGPQDHSVDMEAGGDFVFTWKGQGNPTDPASGIYARYYESTGQPLGGETHINNVIAGAQSAPAVAMRNDIADPRQPFMVTWVTDDPGTNATGIVRREAGKGSVVEFSQATFDLQEPDNGVVPVNVTLKRDSNDVASDTIRIRLTEDTATADDFTSPQDIVPQFPEFTTAFKAGEATANIQLFVKADDLVEGIEEVSFEIITVERDAIGNQKTATLRILDADSDNNQDPDDPDDSNTPTDQDDVLTGTDENDTISGLDGNDTISGGPGNDILNGNDGNDILNGEGGNDVLNGGAGDDELDGGPGKDRLNGGKGKDKLFGGDDNDTLKGGDDNDLLLGEKGNDKLDGGKGNDDLLGGRGNDKLFGLAGNDSLGGQEGKDLLDGGSGKDKLIGEEGNDTLLGGKQGDRLVGGLGNDKLFGDENNDTLIGVNKDAIKKTRNLGRGEKDILNGGGGRDTFALGDVKQVFYDDGKRRNVGRKDFAVIEDFNKRLDKIELHGQASDYRLGAVTQGNRVKEFELFYTGGRGKDEFIAVIQGEDNLKLNGGSGFRFL